MIQVIASATGIIGALFIATGVSILTGYLLFIVSTVLWLHQARFVIKSTSLFTMNLVYFIINIIGIYTYS